MVEFYGKPFFSLFIWNKKEPAKIGFNFRRTQKISACAYFLFSNSSCGQEILLSQTIKRAPKIGAPSFLTYVAVIFSCGELQIEAQTPQ